LFGLCNRIHSSRGAIGVEGMGLYIGWFCLSVCQTMGKGGGGGGMPKAVSGLVYEARMAAHRSCISCPWGWGHVTYQSK
jgi:hypothetical protein